MSRGSPGDGRVARDAVELDRSGIASLSTREEQVLSFAAAGYLDKQIGAEIGISLNTLRTYWQRIRSKVGEAPRTALAVAYTQYLAVNARSPESDEPEHDWEIDLETKVIRKVSSRELPMGMLIGESMALEDGLARIHPEDQPRLRALMSGMIQGELSAYTYAARGISPAGMRVMTVHVRVERDSFGRPVKAYGRRLPDAESDRPAIGDIQVGYWSRDLQTGEFTADEGFIEIFRIGPDEPDLREAAFKRFHPDEIEGCRTFIADTLSAGRDRNRRTHRLIYADGSVRWVTTDLRIEFENGKTRRALGTVMAFC